jgi:hypothetical protein
MLLGILGLLGTALIEQVEINQACRKKEEQDRKDREQIEKCKKYLDERGIKGIAPTITNPIVLPQQNDTELTYKEVKTECLPIQETMVYKTLHGSCYHKSNCKWVYNKKDIITLTISNAKLCKFSPCKECFENENI